jgi:hypothetical protein
MEKENSSSMFKRYIDVECQLIKMQVGIDNESVDKWIKENAKEFSEKWKVSLCKHCMNYHNCGYLLLDDYCLQFEPF